MDRIVTAKIRLYVEHALGAGQSVPVSRDQAHYLFGVMRLGVGAHVLLFDGQRGEWLGEVIEAGKRGGVLAVLDQTRPLQMPPDLWLLFAPIKKARTDFIVEKAVEMGAARILPVQTEFTNSGRIQRDRLQAHAIEAAEQCGGTYVPQVDELIRFDRLMGQWDPARQIMFCDEARAGDATSLPIIDGPWAILIGPEGGFSATERDRLHNYDHCHAVPLGPRILRADTAAVAAMTLWQQQLGDWR
ncbi:16S rRNA (uracil(1498)-N(3))-methyltransferase [Roseobacter sp. YSTF-M11]|uniref:Ribosomal RNA small subunit methyltransferase E n=1 Tax=Roseobacter insulae TaxID=2859783 RepID=A0A9X1K265_9RHOB|nr:16S rRNA (uracil(1498)-N(3))-methyltransferase [Roseobacter insulae]MBW4707217.1 16S rRNA (uracil(1498)-N(3))-methyltransferase [Roseobacter insulae]